MENLPLTDEEILKIWDENKNAYGMVTDFARRIITRYEPLIRKDERNRVLREMGFK